MKLNNGVTLENFGQPYFIAELNTSHFGDLSIAKQMVDAAKEAGADCVKFQSWSADTLYSNTYYRQNPIAKRVVDKFSFDQGELRELAEYAQGVGIGFASTPYSQQEADFLIERCNVPFVKIASMEINNLRFLEYVARTGTAIVLSTGMADEQEIRRAVDCILSAGNENLCVLHCVSIYPADPATINLNNIPALRELRDGLVVGYSDHTLGIEVPIAAVSLGAPVIEKHFTLDSKRIGMDNQMAMEPAEFRSMVSSCRSAWRSLGTRQRVVSEAELAQRSVMRRSVVTLRAIAAGEVIRLEDLDFKRPGDGLGPEDVNLVIGKTAAVDIAADEVIYPPMVRQ